jgi:hypothetical protein
VGLLIRLVEFLIVIVPLVGVIIAGLRAVSRARAHQDDAPTDGLLRRGSDQTAQWQAIKRATREHDRTETRWLDYELAGNWTASSCCLSAPASRSSAESQVSSTASA